MLQDSIVARRIEDPWETKVQDHTWIHMFGSLSYHAQFTLDLSANPYAKVKDPVWLPPLPRIVYWQASSYLGDQLWIWIYAGAVLPLRSFPGYRDLQGQPSHHNCGALQLRFKGTSCLIMHAVDSADMSAHIWQTTWHHISSCELQTNWHNNCKYLKTTAFLKYIK